MPWGNRSDSASWLPDPRASPISQRHYCGEQKVMYNARGTRLTNTELQVIAAVIIPFIYLVAFDIALLLSIYVLGSIAVVHTVIGDYH